MSTSTTTTTTMTAAEWAPIEAEFNRLAATREYGRKIALMYLDGVSKDDMVDWLITEAVLSLAAQGLLS